MAGTKLSEEELFDVAREIGDQSARAAFLDDACKDDSRLRARLEALLSASSQADKIFEGTFQFHSRTTSKKTNGEDSKSTGLEAFSERPGAYIDRYKLLQCLGEGGCGVVYMAEQEAPVRRRVAIKIIKLGMDTKSVIARFEAERQALAMMDHPNIARVLDAGATDLGRPYFVMELVQGVKISEYCDKNHLDIRQRLALFIQICHAIQHAHQKGIIHRDIKPSNILVATHDGHPIPKVIDFGIAKAAEGRLTDKTLITPHAQTVGTPAYMSPEQADGSGLDVDTRTDIYSLGVVLYQSLTGRTPFDPKKLVSSGLTEMRRTLREIDPHRPSAMVTTLEESELTETSICRRIDPPKLISQLRGDIDCIVMKALEKDRTRRYQTANGLAMDIQRYLNNDPISARPPSQFYQFQKLIRRNKGAFAAAAAITLALVMGLGTSTFLFFKEKQARQRAVASEEQEFKLRRQSEARESISRATLLVNQEKFEEASGLISSIPITQSSLESASVFRSIGEWNVIQSRFKPAADCFTSLLEVNHLDGTETASMDLLKCGAVLTELGDANSYERFRRLAAVRFHENENAVTAERILRTSLLLPADDQLLAALNPLADVALANVPINYLRETKVSVQKGDKGKSESSGAKSATPTELPVVVAVHSYDGGNVGVEYSQLMEAQSVTDARNYSLNGTITNVSMGADRKSATLWMATPISGEFSVQVRNVKDLSGMMIAPASVTNTVLGLQLQDFSSKLPYSVSYTGGVATVIAGGWNIWEDSDSFVYAYETVTNDFDYRLRVQSVVRTDRYARAGLMARDSLTNGASREVMIAVNAENTFQTLVRAANSDSTISQPPNPLPAAYGSNSWVRLQRVGTIFSTYTSSNGLDWTKLHQFDSAANSDGPFANPIYLGIAVCAHNSESNTIARVSDMGVTPKMLANITVALALMDYRRGDYDRAAEWSRRSLSHPEYNASRIATAHVILAMACQQLRRTDEARAELAQGQELIEKKFKTGLDFGAGAQSHWFDWLIARTLAREASLLIEAKPRLGLNAQ